VLGIHPYRVEKDDVGRLTGLFPAGVVYTGGAPGDDGPCLVNY
jgi:hypothetical protein